ncbi:hypothetical protein NFI96_006839, partial [Prochilodus magdalenae]
VSYFTSMTRQEEVEKHTTEGIPLFSITYVLAFAFSILSCIRECVYKLFTLPGFPGSAPSPDSTSQSSPDGVTPICPSAPIIPALGLLSISPAVS